MRNRHEKLAWETDMRNWHEKLTWETNDIKTFCQSRIFRFNQHMSKVLNSAQRIFPWFPSILISPEEKGWVSSEVKDFSHPSILSKSVIPFWVSYQSRFKDSHDSMRFRRAFVYRMFDRIYRTCLNEASVTEMSFFFTQRLISHIRTKWEIKAWCGIIS